MSLDVYLTTGEDRVEPCPRCGGTGKISHGPEEVYSANITHNLGAMAKAAGVYEALWHPEEVGVTKAGQLVEPLREGLRRLRADRAHFEQFNAKNGWGVYDDFVPWVEKYLRACEENPEADVRACR